MVEPDETGLRIRSSKFVAMILKGSSMDPELREELVVFSGWEVKLYYRKVEAD